MRGGLHVCAMMKSVLGAWLPGFVVSECLWWEKSMHLYLRA